MVVAICIATSETATMVMVVVVATCIVIFRFGAANGIRVAKIFKLYFFF